MKKKNKKNVVIVGKHDEKKTELLKITCDTTKKTRQMCGELVASDRQAQTVNGQFLATVSSPKKSYLLLCQRYGIVTDPRCATTYRKKQCINGVRMEKLTVEKMKTTLLVAVGDHDGYITARKRLIDVLPKNSKPVVFTGNVRNCNRSRKQENTEGVNYA